MQVPKTVLYEFSSKVTKFSNFSIVTLTLMTYFHLTVSVTINTFKIIVQHF